MRERKMKKKEKWNGKDRPFVPKKERWNGKDRPFVPRRRNGTERTVPPFHLPFHFILVRTGISKYNE